MQVLFPKPIVIYAILALLFLVFSRWAKGLKCVLVASYCGVIVISFTRGTQGAFWLAPLLLFLISSAVIWHPTYDAFDSRKLIRVTYVMFLVLVAGVAVGFLRYDPALEVFKAGAFRTLLGIPVRFLMVAHRLQTILFLGLAIALPLRYYIDRKLFLECLFICWLFSVIMSIAGFLNFVGLVDLTFRISEEVGLFRHVGLLGFRRAGNGLMLIAGIFMTFAMSKLTRSHLLRMAGYVSLPIMAIALFFSFSRAAVVGLLVGGTSLAITLKGRQAVKTILLGAVGGVILYVAVMQFPELQERLGFLKLFYGAGHEPVSAEEYSARRIVGWITTAKWLAGSPGVVTFGTGFQNFAYFVRFSAESVRLGAGHNNWLHMLVELGTAGFIVFNLWLIAVFRWLVSWRRTLTEPIDKLMPSIFISFMLAVTASCLTQESLAPSASLIPWLVHFYLILGIWISYYRTQMLEISSEMEYFEDGLYAYEEPNFSNEMAWEEV